MLKKPLSVLLALVMMLSLVSGLPVMAEGTGETPAETILDSENDTTGDQVNGTDTTDISGNDEDLTNMAVEGLTAPAGEEPVTIPQMVFVYYSAGDGEGGTAFSDMVEADTDLSVRTFDSLSTFKAPAGNHFAGWVGSDNVTVTADEVAAGCSKTIPMIGTDLTASYTFTAYYEPDVVYLCTGVHDGGVCSVATPYDSYENNNYPMNMSLASGDSVTLTATPDKGYEFKGFYKGIRQMDPEQSGYGFVTGYDPESLISSENSYTFTISEDTYIYALFQIADLVTVTFDAKGGTPATKVQIFAVSGKAAEPAAPEKSGWTFGGWYKDEIYSEAFDFNSSVNEDITLYARWDGQLNVYSYDKTEGRTNNGGSFDCECVAFSNKGLYSVDAENIAENTIVWLTAVPAEGYRFIGWAKDTADGEIISSNTAYEFVYKTNPTTLYAVFEEIPPVLTLHWSSLDGVDIMDPVNIEFTRGMTVQDILAAENLDVTGCPFDKEGYAPAGYQVAKPMTEYKDYDEMAADKLDGTEAPDTDCDIYCVMLKEISSVEITLDAPVCGTEVTGEWDDQTNSPSVTLPADVNYHLADMGLPAYWVTDETCEKSFTGTIEGGKDCFVLMFVVAGYGYAFPEAGNVAVNGKAPIMTGRNDDYMGIASSVTAVHAPAEAVSENAVESDCTTAGSHDEVAYCKGCKVELSRTKVTDPAFGHDWSEWKVTKEATETEDGEETRSCSRCDEKETRVIPHLVVEYRVVKGEDSSWQKGSADAVELVFKRSVNDEKAFSHFTGLQVDGKDLDTANYTAESGSVIVKLQPAYLDTLSVGKHTLTAFFDDANDPSLTLTITEKPQPAAPDNNGTAQNNQAAATGSAVNTGDNNGNPLLWFMLLLISAFVLVNTLGFRRKARR